MRRQIRDVIRSDDHLSRGMPSPTSFLSRQLHDWQRYEETGGRRSPLSELQCEGQLVVGIGDEGEPWWMAQTSSLPEARQASDPEDATCGEALEISQARTPGDEAQHAPSPDWFSEPSPLLLDDSLHRESTPNTPHHGSEGEGDSDSDDEAEPLQARPKSGGTCSPRGSCPEGSPCDWCACYPKLSAAYRRLRENVAKNREAGSRKARTGLYLNGAATFCPTRHSQSPRNASPQDHSEAIERTSSGCGASRGGEEDRDEEGGGRRLRLQSSRRTAGPARTPSRTGTQLHGSQLLEDDDDGSDHNATSPRADSEPEEEGTAFQRVHRSLGTSNVDSDDEDGSMQHSESQGVRQRHVGRRRHGDTEGEQPYCPPEDSDGDVARPPPRKRRKTSCPSHTHLGMANGGRIRLDAAPSQSRQAQRGGLVQTHSGQRSIPSPQSSHCCSEEESTSEHPIAKFDQWSLDAILKRVTLGGVATFQIEFSWDPQCPPPARRRLTKRDAATRLAFTREEDDLLIELRSQPLRWKDIHDRFNKAFPRRERSIGTLQTHYCTKLKVRQSKQSSQPSKGSSQ